MIGVLIPAYNAEATVAEAVAGALAHLPRVLVVDDGSGDATGARAAAAGGKVMRHETNRGKGAALQTGFGWMMRQDASAIITMDADLQHDPADIPRFVDAFQQRRADLIIGSRQADFFAMTPRRRFGNRFSCGALSFFAGLELPDSQSGFRLYAAGFVKDLKLRRHAFDAETEVLLVAARNRRRIETIPIAARAVDGTSTSNFHPWLDTLRICRTVVVFSVCTY